MARHLTLDEREVIAQMQRAGKSQAQIAERLGRSKSTVSRELRRNRSRNGYWAAAAQRKAQRRRSERRWVAKMQRPDVRRYVSERLRQRWSPDQIAGRSRSDFPNDRRRQISAPTIYAWIRAEQSRGRDWQTASTTRNGPLTNYRLTKAGKTRDRATSASACGGSAPCWPPGECALKPTAPQQSCSSINSKNSPSPSTTAESGRAAFEREKQNSPLNPDLCEWPAAYFHEGLWFDEWPPNLRVKVLALDPSKGGDSLHGDYSALICLGVDRQGILYVQADLARRPTPQMVADGVELYRKFRPHIFGVEAK